MGWKKDGKDGTLREREHFERRDTFDRTEGTLKEGMEGHLGGHLGGHF